MSLDGAFLHAIQGELTPLINARIERIHQPSREEVILSLRHRAGQSRLLISCNAANARVHITEIPVENPKTPPMFCSLLRRRLGSGKLLNIRQIGLERVLYLDFSTLNELGDVVTLTLACEIMGKYSNLILIDEHGTVIDSLKRVDAEMSSKRLVLPGIPYEMPPKDNRLNFLETTPAEIRSAVRAKGGVLSKALIACFEGISPILAREWAYYTTGDIETPVSALTEDQLDRLCFIIGRAKDILETQKVTYTIVQTRDGTPKDFTFFPVRQYGNAMVTRPMPTACKLLDAFYADRDARARLKQRANDLFLLLLRATDRVRRRIATQTGELDACAEKETLKRHGDLLSANLYALKKGDKKAIVADFYEPNSPPVEIPLDERLTPAQNAQKYYRAYKKATRAEQVLREQIEKGQAELAYLDSVLDVLTRAETENDLEQLRLELSEQGYLHLTRRRTPPKSIPPMVFFAKGGTRILVGRNNKQNDQLTFKTADKRDIWLHTQNIPGSHVILETKGEEVPFSTLQEAAQAAAYYSKARDSSQVPVDYCMVKYVKKPAGARPGFVIFSNQHTLYVTPKKPSARPQKESDPS